MKWGFSSIFALKSISKFCSNPFWGLIWNFWRVSSLIRFIVIYRFPDPSLVRNICFFLFVRPIKKLANIFYLYIFKNFKIMENLFHDMTTLQIAINIIATWITTFFEYTDKTEPYNKTCEVKFNFSLNTLKPWYNEPNYSEFRYIVNKTQLPFWGFTKHITFEIVNYSI